MKRICVFAVLASAALLAACGGGGGGGGGIAINYEGEKTPVQLDESNAAAMGDLVYDVADAESTFYNPVDEGNTRVAARVTRGLARHAVARLESETFTGSCGGSVTLSASGSSMSGRATFSDFCSDGIADPQIDTEGQFLDGFVSLAFSEAVSGTNYTGRLTTGFDLDIKPAPLDTPPLALTRGTVGYLVHGKDAFESFFGWDFTYVDEKFTYNLLVGSPDYAFYIWFNDFVSFTGYDPDGFEDYYTVEGRIYFSDRGYVDLSTAVDIDADGQSGELLIKGANNSWLKIAISPTWNYQIYLETGDSVPPAFDDPFDI